MKTALCIALALLAARSAGACAACGENETCQMLYLEANETHLLAPLGGNGSTLVFVSSSAPVTLEVGPGADNQTVSLSTGDCLSALVAADQAGALVCAATGGCLVRTRRLGADVLEAASLAAGTKALVAALAAALFLALGAVGALGCRLRALGMDLGATDADREPTP
jgi:hypothetical protein